MNDKTKLHIEYIIDYILSEGRDDFVDKCIHGECDYEKHVYYDAIVAGVGLGLIESVDGHIDALIEEEEERQAEHAQDMDPLVEQMRGET